MTQASDLADQSPHAKLARPTVYYVLPGLSVGGVETALGKSFNQLLDDVDLRVATLDRTTPNLQGIPSRRLDFLLLREIFASRSTSILLTSLWRAHLLGLLLCPFGVNWVAFFHNAFRAGHPLDRMVCYLAARFASHCLFDSKQTKQDFETLVGKPLGSIVPFLIRPPKEAVASRAFAPTPRPIDIIYVGRLVPIKRLDLCASLVEAVVARSPQAKFSFIGQGPDAVVLNQLARRFPNNVDVLGMLSNHEARSAMSKSKFIVCLSDFEGMAMALIEGIQEGCVPIVRLSGEIPNYVDNDCGVICAEPFSPSEIASELAILLSDHRKLAMLSERAQSNIRQYPDYASTLSSELHQFAKRISAK
ncbi:MAG: glycosyltransferase [Betaproteobacteria bacterium]|nr:glycosyltransferase [Betaproteobacteria bacterium]